MKTMKLIDADALYNGAMKNEYFQFKESDKTGREAFAYSCAMERLVEAPAVDAAPIVHAQWIEEPGYYHWHCSACGFVEGVVSKLFYHYCPNCGAKIDGGENGAGQ